jgi:hypothetical protein
MDVSTVSTPSAPSTTRAFAFCIGLPRIAAAMPYPTNHSPSRTWPGFGLRFAQPKSSAAFCMHAISVRVEKGLSSFGSVFGSFLTRNSIGSIPGGGHSRELRVDPRALD